MLLSEFVRFTNWIFTHYASEEVRLKVWMGIGTVLFCHTKENADYGWHPFGLLPKERLSVICSSVVGQLRWKGHIKKHKKFLIFLINKLDFISLRKIRNNDRTIEYIIQAADIHFG